MYIACLSSYAAILVPIVKEDRYNAIPRFPLCLLQWRTQDFFRGGIQQIQLRTEDRGNGDLGAVAP